MQSSLRRKSHMSAVLLPHIYCSNDQWSLQTAPVGSKSTYVGKLLKCIIMNQQVGSMCHLYRLRLIRFRMLTLTLPSNSLGKFFSNFTVIPSLQSLCTKAFTHPGGNPSITEICQNTRNFSKFSQPMMYNTFTSYTDIILIKIHKSSSGEKEHMP